MTDKQPAPVGDCHIVGKAVVPEDFGQLEAEAKRLQELMVSASMECAGKQQEALAEAMEAYLKVSTPSVMLSLLRQNADLKAERDAMAAENAALKGAQGFFAYGSERGYEEFDTAEEAQEAAEEELAYYRGEACDGWSDEVGSVVWGVTMQRATMTGLRPVTEDDSVSPDIKEICDYALLPKVETPATDAAIAEIKAQGVEELATLMEANGYLHEANGSRVFAARLRKGGAV